MSSSKLSWKKKSLGEKIQLSGQILRNIWVNSPVLVYKNLNDVISFFHQDKFPYLWPDLKDYIESINESDNPQEELKFQWLKLYLYHPDKQVRKAVVELNAKNDSWSISQTLCDLLIDPAKMLELLYIKLHGSVKNIMVVNLLLLNFFTRLKVENFTQPLDRKEQLSH